MGFIDQTTKDQLRIARSLFYDDLVEFRFQSGTDALQGGAQAFTVGGSGSLIDAFNRPSSMEPERYGVTTGELLVSGTFSWISQLDRRFIPAGMAEEGGAMFSCSDEFFMALSGSRIFAVKDGIQMSILNMTSSLTTGEMVIILGNKREDNF